MGFAYWGNTLFTDQVSIPQIAKETGIPFYVYLLDEIVERTRRLHQAFGSMGEGNYIDCVPVKTWANLAFLRAMARGGCGADISSEGELARSLHPKVRMDTKKIVFTGPGKTEQDITLGIEEGILMFVIESLEELKLINAIGQAKGIKVPVACRVNPDISTAAFPNLAVGLRENQFGIAHEESVGYQPQGEYVTSIFQDAQSLPYVVPIGIHFHIGSQITTLDAITQAIKLTISILNTVRGQGIDTIEYFGIGGGLPIVYRPGERFTLGSVSIAPGELDEKIFKDLIPQIVELVKPTGCKLWTEIGRFRVGYFGALITRVLYRKTMRQKDGSEKVFYVLKAGMNDLARPAMYGKHAHHDIIPVVRINREDETADFVGWCCESSDKFGISRLTPCLERGELVAILSAGAYGSTMSSNYCGRLLCPEILVSGKNWWQVRRRQTPAEMMMLESVPEELDYPSRSEG